MVQNIKPTVETGAMTLVLLVKNYRSQMIALLLKNGVIVPNGATEQQIASLMASLLKVSKSFYADLNNFLKNPNVLENLSRELSIEGQYFKVSGGNFVGKSKGNAQYFRASGSNFAGKSKGNAQYFRASGFMNSFGDEEVFEDTEDVEPTNTSVKPKKDGFFSGLKLGDLLNKGIDLITTLDDNKTDREIANARKKAGLPVEEDPSSDEKDENGGEETPDEGLSTTTIVVLSLVGVAIIGTIIYFVSKAKK